MANKSISPELGLTDIILPQEPEMNEENWAILIKSVETKTVTCEKARVACEKSTEATEAQLRVIRQVQSRVEEMLLRQHIMLEMLTVIIRNDNKGDHVQIKYGSDGNLNIAADKFTGGSNG